MVSRPSLLLIHRLDTTKCSSVWTTSALQPTFVPWAFTSNSVMPWILMLDLSAPTRLMLGGGDSFKCSLFAISLVIMVTWLPVSGRPLHFINFFPPGAASHKSVALEVPPWLLVATSTAAAALPQNFLLWPFLLQWSHVISLHRWRLCPLPPQRAHSSWLLLFDRLLRPPRPCCPRPLEPPRLMFGYLLLPPLNAAPWFS